MLLHMLFDCLSMATLQVFFDLADVVDGETVERDDIVEFDIVEGTFLRTFPVRLLQGTWQEFLLAY